MKAYDGRVGKDPRILTLMRSGMSDRWTLGLFYPRQSLGRAEMKNNERHTME